MKYQIEYKFYHLEESDDRTEYEIEAPDAGMALLQFMDIMGREVDQQLREDITRFLAEASLIDGAYVTHDHDILQWEELGGEYIYQVDCVGPQETEICPTCEGRGRVPGIRV